MLKHLLKHSSPTVPQTLQQLELHGPYLVVQKQDMYHFKSRAWKVLHDNLLKTQAIDFLGQDSESSFVKNTGWMGYVEGQMDRCQSMSAVDDDIGLSILEHISSHLKFANDSLRTANITLKRWLGSERYQVLPYLILTT
jgi:hypothetical protein